MVCERVVVVAVVEEEWLKSSSAAKNTTGLHARNACSATFQSHMSSGLLSWTERLYRRAGLTMHDRRDTQ